MFSEVGISYLSGMELTGHKVQSITSLWMLHVYCVMYSIGNVYYISTASLFTI